VGPASLRRARGGLPHVAPGHRRMLGSCSWVPVLFSLACAGAG
jgi:hypothetical protein